MSLEVFIKHALPSFSLEASFKSAGRLTALFGPSGCGKTTIVNVIAGLVRPLAARIECDGEVLADTERGIWRAPHQRQVGYVFQDARLLPHLSVRQNLRYGQWFTPRQKRYADEADIVELLGLAPLLERRPRQLSGGEKQRVAIGRALLQSPRLLLMDEPLASLDETRKREIMPYIERLRDETRVPIVYVSHAVAEVTRLATDVILLQQGRIVTSGSLQKVMNALSVVDDELSREAGSVLEATVRSYDASTGLTTLSSAAGDIRLAGDLGPEGKPIRLHVRASDVTLATMRPEQLSALNIIEGVVERITGEAASVTVSIRCQAVTMMAQVTRYSAQALDLREGKRVYAIIKAMSVRPPVRGAG